MRKGKGWSLLELLTVIGIIAILVAILFPVFARAKEAAKKAVCLSNVSQLAKAARLYSLDYNDYICCFKGRANCKPVAPGMYGQGYYMKKIYKDYVPAWGIWFCPSDQYAKTDFTTATETFGSFNYKPFTAEFKTSTGGYWNGADGYTAIDHSADTDVKITALNTLLIAKFGYDDMKNDHNDLGSYRHYNFYEDEGIRDYEGLVVLIDNIERTYRGSWGAYGYWDINPSNCDIFEEDIPMHGRGLGPAGENIQGRTYGFRDGHGEFRTVDVSGINNYGELNDGF